MNSKSYNHLIQIAVKSFQELQRKNDLELKQWLSTQPLFPSTIPVGHGGFAFITAEGYSALKELGQTWHRNDATR
jgi:hypothetical protein